MVVGFFGLLFACLVKSPLSTSGLSSSGRNDFRVALEENTVCLAALLGGEESQEELGKTVHSFGAPGPCSP